MKRISAKRFNKKQGRTKVFATFVLVALIFSILLLLRFYIPENLSDIPFVRSTINSQRLSEFVSNYETNYFLNVNGQTNWNSNTLSAGRIISTFAPTDRQNRLENAAKQVRANLIFETLNNLSPGFAVQHITQTIKYPRYARYRLEAIPLLPGESFTLENDKNLEFNDIFLVNALCTQDRVDGKPSVNITLDENPPVEHPIEPNGKIAKIKLDKAGHQKIIINWPPTAPGVLFLLGTQTEQNEKTDNKILITIDEISGKLNQELPRTLEAIGRIKPTSSQMTVWPEYENSLQNLQFLYNNEGNTSRSNDYRHENIFKTFSKKGYRPLAINLESAHPCYRTICNLEDIFLRNRYIQSIPENLTIPFEKNIKTAYGVFGKKLSNPEGLLTNLNITTRPNALHYTWNTALGRRGSVISWLASSIFDVFTNESTETPDRIRERETNVQIDELLAETINQFKNSSTEINLYIKKVIDNDVKLGYEQGYTYPGLLITTHDLPNSMMNQSISLNEVVKWQILLGSPTEQPKHDSTKYVQMEQGDLWLFHAKDMQNTKQPTAPKMAYMNSLTLLESLEARNQGPIVSPLDKNFKQLLSELKSWIETRRIYSFIVKSKARSGERQELKIKTQNKFLMCHANHNDKFIFYDGVAMTIRWPAQMENDFYVVCQMEENPEAAEIEIFTDRTHAMRTRFGQYAVVWPYNDSEHAISIQKNQFQNWLYADAIPYLEEKDGTVDTLIWLNHRVDWNIDDYLFLQFDALNVP